MADIIPAFVVALTCPNCYEMPFECECPSWCEINLGCTPSTPCSNCFADLMRRAERDAGWILEA